MNIEHSNIDNWLSLNNKIQKSSQNDRVKKILATIRNCYKDDEGLDNTNEFFSLTVNSLKEIANTVFESSRNFNDSKSKSSEYPGSEHEVTSNVFCF